MRTGGPQGRIARARLTSVYEYAIIFMLTRRGPGQNPDRAGVAQPVEQLICNQQVGGSNPSTSSRACVERLMEKGSLQAAFFISPRDCGRLNALEKCGETITAANGCDSRLDSITDAIGTPNDWPNNHTPPSARYPNAPGYDQGRGVSDPGKLRGSRRHRAHLWNSATSGATATSAPRRPTTHGRNSGRQAMRFLPSFQDFTASHAIAGILGKKWLTSPRKCAKIIALHGAGDKRFWKCEVLVPVLRPNDNCIRRSSRVAKGGRL